MLMNFKNATTFAIWFNVLNIEENETKKLRRNKLQNYPDNLFNLCSNKKKGNNHHRFIVNLNGDKNNIHTFLLLQQWFINTTIKGKFDECTVCITNGAVSREKLIQNQNQQFQYRPDPKQRVL